MALSDNILGGLLVSIILMIFTAGFCKLIVFAFESDVLMEISDEPGTQGGISKRLHREMQEQEKIQGPASRILPEPEGLVPLPASRVVSSSSVSEAEKAEREENKALTEMFRVL